MKIPKTKSKLQLSECVGSQKDSERIRQHHQACSKTRYRRTSMQEVDTLSRLPRTAGKETAQPPLLGLRVKSVFKAKFEIKHFSQDLLWSSNCPPKGKNMLDSMSAWLGKSSSENRQHLPPALEKLWNIVQTEKSFWMGLFGRALESLCERIWKNKLATCLLWRWRWHCHHCEPNSQKICLDI